MAGVGLTGAILGMLGSSGKSGKAMSECGSVFIESGAPAMITTYQIPVLAPFCTSECARRTRAL